MQLFGPFWFAFWVSAFPCKDPSTSADAIAVSGPHSVSRNWTPKPAQKNWQNWENRPPCGGVRSGQECKQEARIDAASQLTRE